MNNSSEILQALESRLGTDTVYQLLGGSVSPDEIRLLAAAAGLPVNSDTIPTAEIEVARVRIDQCLKQ